MNRSRIRAKSASKNAGKHRSGGVKPGNEKQLKVSLDSRRKCGKGKGVRKGSVNDYVI
jgi:hypothetical protein